MKVKSHPELTEWVEQSERLWLFLDYDGTLADFAATPDEIVPDTRLITLLERLARKPGLRVTILSGRRLAHIRELLPVPGIMLAGTYGVELLSEQGDLIHRVALTEIRPFLESIKPAWSDLIAGQNGFYLEDKEWALALHARFAEDAEASEVLGKALEVATLKLPSGTFRILGGHKFLEVAPRIASKRETVAYLLQQYPLPQARLMYIGDDDKDEEAFPLIHDHGGVAVKVIQPSQSNQATTANYFFHSPQDTLAWLEELLDAE
ncbi:MAG TPA: trehalose-phosphatase [Anaerolineales bacterium]|nr:trehalose-phosphatase [Anaerolineales bacterium]